MSSSTARQTMGTRKRSRTLVGSFAVVLVVCAQCTSAFIPVVLSPRAGLRRMVPGVVEAKGFGKGKTSPPPEDARPRKVPISAPTSPEVGLWEKEYKAYINRTGEYLCSMSWEGHEKMGRGAIFANYDDARKDLKAPNKVEMLGGIPSMYVPLSEFESMQGAKEDEANDLAQIINRVETYRPEKEFVVVFQAAGVMGTDVVKPSISPPEMAKYVVSQESEQDKEVVEGSNNIVGEDGVIDVTPIEL